MFVIFEMHKLGSVTRWGRRSVHVSYKKKINKIKNKNKDKTKQKPTHKLVEPEEYQISNYCMKEILNRQ